MIKKCKKPIINRYYYEKKYSDAGYKLIGGIDEVGRGCWAGPVTSALVILPPNYKNDMIRDSKTLSKNKRYELAQIIMRDAIDYQIEFLSALVIDEMNNIKLTTIQTMNNCVQNIKMKPDFILVDYEKINSSIPSLSLVKGDQKSISIAAASIIAKVSRDEYMDKLHTMYPQYHFDKNKGYCTKQHLDSIKKYGVISGLHRLTFKPLSRFSKRK